MLQLCALHNVPDEKQRGSQCDTADTGWPVRCMWTHHADALPHTRRPASLSKQHRSSPRGPFNRRNDHLQAGVEVHKDARIGVLRVLR